MSPSPTSSKLLIVIINFQINESYHPKLFKIFIFSQFLKLKNTSLFLCTQILFSDRSYFLKMFLFHCLRCEIIIVFVIHLYGFRCLSHCTFIIHIKLESSIHKNSFALEMLSKLRTQIKDDKTNTLLF